jgi:hypothetical protein
MAVMALSPEGTEPDMDVLRRFLSIKQQSHAQTQINRFHLLVDWAAHSHSIAVMALSPEGTDPDIDDARTSREVSDSIEDGNVPASPFCLKSLHANLMPSC